MPAQMLRRLTSKERTLRANRQLGYLLAFVAGAVNAGGFLAVQRYTSHMTGIISSMADHLALGAPWLALAALVSLGAFMAGAVTTTLLILWARRRAMHSEYALPLMLEAGLLLVFGLMGANLQRWTEWLVPGTVLLLCFIMGLQNAVVTKISNAEIRTTHMTGVVTDLGIELGRLLYGNRDGAPASAPSLHGNRERLFVLATLLAMFLIGSLFGVLAFQGIGFAATVPIAVLLMVIALIPVLDDLTLTTSGPP
jgi:uncharacterized membrane protein YoaK (UPF0700 family)